MRPVLNKDLSAVDFTQYYWLKEELVSFCRQAGLSTAGSKQELSGRIQRFLEGGQAAAPQTASAAPQRGSMPRHFNRQSVIGEGWRCSQALRQFFQQEIGKTFHFDGVMRDFIHQGVGRTLDEAITAWKTAQMNPEKKEIGSQFEYNRHMRTYFQTHPGATPQEARQAWKSIREARRDEGESHE
ncbi:MAG TPA: DUF6434 domain-containing protein [Anaerolineaceae bacterium]|nr:DUF6434 domain-containing protein [Anaerolineaceae bacterium]HPN53199.1 DUF6434 domain-containing protein [Anaerolineaceae bacterium]